MKKNLILTLALTTAMAQTAFAADSTTSASTKEETKPATTTTNTNTSTKTTTSTGSKTTTSTSSKTTTSTTTTTKTAQAGDTKYVIVWGDTLNDIAAKYNTTADALAAYNGIKDKNKIYAGNTILIPAAKPVVTTPVTPEKPVVTTPVTPTKPVNPETVTPTVPVITTPDAVTSPSITDDADVLVKALSTSGTWIACTTADVTVEETLFVEGEFHSKNDPTQKVYRKLGLYTQDDAKNVTGEFNLDLPNGMVVDSPNFRVQNGTINGDIFVNAPGFELKGATVNGNITFASQELQDSALLAEGTVNGTVTVEGVSPVSTYVGINSEYNTSDATNNWDYFVAIDVQDGQIVSVDWNGKNETIANTKDEEAEAGKYGMIKASKIGKEWHEQAKVLEDALVEYQTTDVFQLAEDGLHLASINGVDSTASASIKVNDFIKYADQAIAKANGELPATATVDAISTASLTTDADTLQQALSAEGNWLVAAIGDTTVEGQIVVDGEFHYRGDETQRLYRKITPSNHVYGEDGVTRDKTKEEFYVLTATEGMVINSPNTNLVNGTFVGDITVNSNGFVASNMTIIGNVYFTSQEARDSATFTNTNVTGDVTPAVSAPLVDGIYKGTGEIAADTKYQEQVTIVVKWGQLVSVNYNPLKVVDGAAGKEGKKELDAAGNYPMKSEVGTWTQQANKLEAYALAGNTAPGADGVTGASIGTDEFFTCFNDALAQAQAK